MRHRSNAEKYHVKWSEALTQQCSSGGN